MPETTAPSLRYFRPPRPGPELQLETAVANRLDEIFPATTSATWKGASIPLGAGMPDIVLATFRPEVFALLHVEMPSMQVVAYLRAVTRATPNKIAEHVGRPPKVIVRNLEQLSRAEMIVPHGDAFALSPAWREILPEIVTIEVKVSDWKRAVAQASRNRIFAHRSYVALPSEVAQRVKCEPSFHALGIGLMGVSTTGEVLIVRKGRRRLPKVWTYYYKLASIVAQFSEEAPQRGLHDQFTTGAGGIS